MSAFRRAFALTVITFAVTAVCFGATIDLTTSLSPVAGTTSNGLGSFTGTFDTATAELMFTLSWTDLTSSLVNAHIHLAPVPGGNGGVLIPFFADGGVETITPAPPTLPLGNSGTLTEMIRITDAATLANFNTGLATGRLYVNVHSTNFPIGEIRGNLPANAAGVPEPSSFLLIGGGLVVVSLLCRRR